MTEVRGTPGGRGQTADRARRGHEGVSGFSVDSDLSGYSGGYAPLGKRLKKAAKSSGAFIRVALPNVGALTTALAEFFYYKKHEWIAVCFLDDDLRCVLLWFNKGPSKRTVRPKLDPVRAAQVATEMEATHILLAHNHPVATEDVQATAASPWIHRYDAHNIAKQNQMDFSAADEAVAGDWLAVLSPRGIGFASAVVVTRQVVMQGDPEIVNNFKRTQHQYAQSSSRGGQRVGQQGCFIATAVYGEKHWRTDTFREFRDQVLRPRRLGRWLCSRYYAFSPMLIEVFGQNRVARKLATLLLDPLSRLLATVSSDKQ